MNISKLFIIILLSLVATGCGGNSEESGILLEGTLTQGGEAVQYDLVVLRHAAGQPIDNVQVCALGKCSTTDSQGQWGFIAPDEFSGGELLFSVNGHGIISSLVVDIPHGAREVSIELENHTDEGVHAHSVVTDGADHEEEGDHTH